jgi:hypothetical protein
MTNLANALSELRAERGKAQAQVEKLDQAISVIESLNGSLGSRGGAGSRRAGSQRLVSAAARRRMSLAQKARWARVRKPQSGSASATTARKPLSISARRRIAAAQRLRWARVRAQQSKAA